MLVISIMSTKNLQIVQTGFIKGRGTRDQIANICWIIEKARIPEKKKKKKNIFLCFIDYTRAFDCMDHNKLWKVLKEMVISNDLTCTCETCMQVKKQQLEPYREQQTGSRLRKE